MSEAVATVALGGRLIALKCSTNIAGNSPGATRRAIVEFSKAARRRLMHLIQSIDRRQVVKMPLFVTLTYPASFPTDAPVFKRHLDTFLKRLYRAYPEVSCIWKLEMQQRGAPHYHLLMFGVQFLPAKWVAKTWYEVVGSGDVLHLAAGCEVKRVWSWRGVGWYVAKYMAKAGEKVLINFPGRFWGVHNKAKLPQTLFEYEMSWSEFVWTRRIMRRYAHAHHFHFGGYSPESGGTLYLDWQVGLKLIAFVFTHLAEVE